MADVTDESGGVLFSMLTHRLLSLWGFKSFAVCTLVSLDVSVVPFSLLSSQLRFKGSFQEEKQTELGSNAQIWSRGCLTFWRSFGEGEQCQSRSLTKTGSSPSYAGKLKDLFEDPLWLAPPVCAVMVTHTLLQGRFCLVLSPYVKVWGLFYVFFTATERSRAYKRLRVDLRDLIWNM